MVNIGAANIEHMIEARGAIMGQVVRLASERRTNDNLTQLRSELSQVRKRPTASDDMEARTHQALNFNVYIARASANPVLTTIVEALTTSMADLIRPIRPSSFAPLVKYYSDIIDAIDQQNPDLAAEIMDS